jgi:hypothetical protein
MNDAVNPLAQSVCERQTGSAPAGSWALLPASRSRKRATSRPGGKIGGFAARSYSPHVLFLKRFWFWDIFLAENSGGT